MSVASTIAEKQGKTKPSKNEQAARREELSESIVNKEFRAASPSPKRPRGRPPKNPSTSPKVQRKPETPEELAENLRKRKCVRKLKALKNLFPEELGPSLRDFDYASANVSQIEHVIDACKFALEDDIETQFYPSMILQSLDSVSKLGTAAAALQPNHPVLKYGNYLQHFGEFARADPGIVKEAKLMSIDMIGTLPTSPLFRMCALMGQAAYACVNYNINARTDAEMNVSTGEDFKDL